jgi:hypothetical protein
MNTPIYRGAVFDRGLVDSSVSPQFKGVIHRFDRVIHSSPEKGGVFSCQVNPNIYGVFCNILGVRASNNDVRLRNISRSYLNSRSLRRWCRSALLMGTDICPGVQDGIFGNDDNSVLYHPVFRIVIKPPGKRFDY